MAPLVAVTRPWRRSFGRGPEGEALHSRRPSFSRWLPSVPVQRHALGGGRGAEFVHIQYLRDYLHLPPEIVPATLRKATKPQDGRFGGRDVRQGGPPRGDRDGGDRDAYRREGGSGDARLDKGGAGDNFKPEFRGGMGGIGRGRGGPPASGGFGAPPPANAGGFGAPPPS